MVNNSDDEVIYLDDQKSESDITEFSSKYNSYKNSEPSKIIDVDIITSNKSKSIIDTKEGLLQNHYESIANSDGWEVESNISHELFPIAQNDTILKPTIIQDNYQPLLVSPFTTTIFDQPHSDLPCSKRLVDYGIKKFEQNMMNKNEDREKYENELKSESYSSKIKSDEFDLIKKINKGFSFFDNYNEINLWQDNNTFFYRTSIEENITQGNKEEISKLISIYLQEDILIINSISDTHDNTNKKVPLGFISKYIRSSSIKKIYEAFNPYQKQEFYVGNNSIEYRNKFKYPKILNEIESNPKKYYSSSGFINNFISAISKNKFEEEYIINWLANLFQLKEKANIALVLVGDEELSKDIFYDLIIKEVFGSKLCITIDDDLISKETFDNILEEKILYHLVPLSEKVKKTKIAKDLIRTIMIKSRTSIDDASNLQNEDINIYGKTLITVDNINDTFLKDIKSRCFIVEINSLDNVISKLSCIDSMDLYSKINDNLSHFLSFLLNYRVDNNLLSSKNRRIENKNTAQKIDENIIIFIKNIFLKNVDYFIKIKDKDIELYHELIHNFDENMIARSKLYLYFNIIYNDKIFPKNSELLKLLKDKDTFFNQNIDKNSQYNREKRYKLPEN